MANSSFFGTSGTTASVTNTIQTSVDAAATSATNAETAKTAAETAKAAAETAQAAAAASQTAAATSATASASSADTSANSATASQTAQAASESARDTANSHKTAAATSETNSAASATAAANSATSASTSASSASTSLASFQGQYSTGTTDPTTNLDTGDLFFNSSSGATGGFKVYSGSAWQLTVPSSSNQTNINTVAGIQSDVTAVAGKATEIGRLGTTDAVADMNLLGTSTNVTNMATLANVSGNITTVANNVTGVNSFADRYRVGTSDPSSNNDGGDLFYNTTSSTLKVYNSATSAWEQGVTAGSGFLPTTGGGLTGNLTLNNANLIFEGSTADANETSLTVTDPTADRTITLPDKTGTVVTVAADGTTGQLLRTDGSGNYSFVTVQTNLSGDSNPTLSGDLDVGTSDIISSSNNDISLLPNGTGKVVMDGNGSSGGISITDGLIEMRSGTSSPAQIDLYCEVSNAHKVSIKAPAHANYSGNVNFTLPAGHGTSGQFLQGDGAGNLTYATVAQPGNATTSTAGLMSAADKTKMDGIETGATADQSDAEIKTAYENNSDTNAFTDALLSKLNAIEASATADQTDAEIKTAYENNSDTNAFTDALQTKLNGIATSATAVGGSNGVDFADSVKARFGTGNDLEIYHDGASRLVDNGSGPLALQGNQIKILNTASTETMAVFAENGAVELYHDNSKKFETTSSGVSVTGSNFNTTGNFGRDTNDRMAVETDHIDFYINGNIEARLESDGDFHADGDVVAFSTTISDERLKTDITKIDGAVDKVGQLNGYTFTYKADGKQSAGVIAQEVEKVLPSAVREKELPLKADDGVAYKTVQYDQLVGLLIEAVNELTARVQELERA